MRLRASGLRRSGPPLRVVRLPRSPAAVIGCSGADQSLFCRDPKRGGSIVIPALTRPGPGTGRAPEWPREPQARANTPWPLFQPRPALRRLAVLADADLLTAPDDADMTRAALLTGLLTHPYLKVLRYQDEGPATHQPGDGEPLKGWARLLAPDDEEYRGLVYTHDSGESTYTWVSARSE